jgi:hypothetical protein
MTLHWLSLNWFYVVETIALIASLTIAASALRSSGHATKGANLLAVTAAHRNVWQQVLINPALKSVLRPTMTADDSITDEEREFVLQVLQHSEAVFQVLQMGALPPNEGLRRDVYDTMQLPVFQIVWNDYKKYQNTAFVTFIDDCMAGVNLDASVGRVGKMGLLAIRMQVIRKLQLVKTRRTGSSGPEIAQHPPSS